jgi:RimJ/RimL family protein N-acetyltransferase
VTAMLPQYDARLTRAGLVHVRRAEPADRAALRDMHERLSASAIYFRYFTGAPHLSRELNRLLRPVDDEHETLVALVDDTIVGVACYERIVPHAAEVAFLIDDSHRGVGLATLLLDILAASARRNGITEFRAVTLSGNVQMMNVFRDCGLQYFTQADGDEVQVRIPLNVVAPGESWPTSVVDVLTPPLLPEPS